MTDVFLFYDSSDRDRARPVRDALNAQGFDVHWDQEAPAGTEWETWVPRRIARSKCVVVLHSAASAQSNRMSHVAALAEARGKLIVVRLEPRSSWQTLAQGPAQSQGQGHSLAGAGDALDLANWSGDPEHTGWQELGRRIDSKLRSSLWVQRLTHGVEVERARWRAQYEASAARSKALNGELAHERYERAAAQDKVAGLEAQLDADSKARLRLQISVTEVEQRLTAAEARHAQVEAALAKARDAHIAGLDARLAERDAEAEGLRAVAAAREAELASLRGAIAERDTEVARLQMTVTQRDADVASLRAALAQRDADIGSLRASLEARNAEVSGLTATLGQRDAEARELGADLAGLQASIAERDSYMSDLEASVTQRDTYIGRLTDSLADRRAYMADLEASIAQRDTHIADLKTNVAERDTQITSLRAALKELKRRSEARHASGVALPTLGRVTLPLVGLAGAALSLLKMRQG